MAQFQPSSGSAFIQPVASSITAPKERIQRGWQTECALIESIASLTLPVVNNFADLDIRCRDGSIQAHQVILGSHSSFLKSLFATRQSPELNFVSLSDQTMVADFWGSRKDESVTILLPDFSKKDVELLMHLLYLGQCAVNSSNSNAVPEILNQLWRVLSIDSFHYRDLKVALNIIPILNPTPTSSTQQHVDSTHSEKVNQNASPKKKEGCTAYRKVPRPQNEVSPRQNCQPIGTVEEIREKDPPSPDIQSAPQNETVMEIRGNGRPLLAQQFAHQNRTVMENSDKVRPMPAQQCAQQNGSVMEIGGKSRSMLAKQSIQRNGIVMEIGGKDRSIPAKQSDQQNGSVMEIGGKGRSMIAKESDQRNGIVIEIEGKGRSMPAKQSDQQNGIVMELEGKSRSMPAKQSTTQQNGIVMEIGGKGRLTLAKPSTQPTGTVLEIREEDRSIPAKQSTQQTASMVAIRRKDGPSEAKQYPPKNSGQVIETPKEYNCEYCDKVIKLRPWPMGKKQNCRVFIMHALTHFTETQYADVPLLNTWFCPYESCSKQFYKYRHFFLHLATYHDEFVLRIDRRLTELQQNGPWVESMRQTAKRDEENKLKRILYFAEHKLGLSFPPVESRLFRDIECQVFKQLELHSDDTCVAECITCDRGKSKFKFSAFALLHYFMEHVAQDLPCVDVLRVPSDGAKLMPHFRCTFEPDCHFSSSLRTGFVYHLGHDHDFFRKLSVIERIPGVSVTYLKPSVSTTDVSVENNSPFFTCCSISGDYRQMLEHFQSEHTHDRAILVQCGLCQNYLESATPEMFERENHVCTHSSAPISKLKPTDKLPLETDSREDEENFQCSDDRTSICRIGPGSQIDIGQSEMQLLNPNEIKIEQPSFEEQSSYKTIPKRKITSETSNAHLTLAKKVCMANSGASPKISDGASRVETVSARHMGMESDSDSIICLDSEDENQ